MTTSAEIAVEWLQRLSSDEADYVGEAHEVVITAQNSVTSIIAKPRPRARKLEQRGIASERKQGTKGWNLPYDFEKKGNNSEWAVMAAGVTHGVKRKELVATTLWTFGAGSAKDF